MMFNSINTDKELASILGRFSDETIVNLIDEALFYKYRPFDNRMPNLPETVSQQFNNLRMCSSIDIDVINDAFRHLHAAGRRDGPVQLGWRLHHYLAHLRKQRCAYLG